MDQQQTVEALLTEVLLTWAKGKRTSKYCSLERSRLLFRSLERNATKYRGMVEVLLTWAK